MEKTVNRIQVYTDGSHISANQNSGIDAIGWSAICLIDHNYHIAHGFEHNQRNLSKQQKSDKATSSRSELLAVVKSLKLLRSMNLKSSTTLITIYTDSQYVIDIFNKLTNEESLPNKNTDLWNSLLKIKLLYKISFCKVKAHSGNILNNHADILARKSARHGLSSENKILQLVDNNVINYINNLLNDNNISEINIEEIENLDNKVTNDDKNNDLVIINPFELKSKHGVYSIVKIKDDKINLLFNYYIVLFLANNTVIHTVLNTSNAEVYTDIEICYQVCIDHNNLKGNQCVSE